MTWEEELELSNIKTPSDVKVLTKTSLFPVPPSIPLLRVVSSAGQQALDPCNGAMLANPCKEPIKEPINISSLLSQKHSYRSFQAGTIRGQTSICYGSEHLSSLLPPSVSCLCPSPLSSHRRGFLKTTVVSATSTLNKSLTIRYPRNTISFPVLVKWPQVLLLVLVRGREGDCGEGLFVKFV